MRTERPDNVQIHQRKKQNSQLYQQSRRVRRGGGGPLPDITLRDILRHLWLGANKLLVALRYQFHRLTAGAFSNLRLPWYKIAFAVFILLIVTKKDIQFSINMKAPLSGFSNTDAAGSQMSLAQPIALRQTENGGEALQLDEQKALAYIRRFSKVAAAEMDKFGIPASVKMAQGLLESRAGENPEARQANNHFGEPLAGRHFNSAWENWRAHSLLLRNEYPGLFRNGAGYKQWAEALQRSGYTNDSQYARRLIELIENFQLYNLDQF
ncbi:MAG: glucosaminidase domain-containing protein [Phaeodactylibacter sp.]|nr:glucosaminidase domain-containing protein [Phaeodactylibacter sp.]